MTTVNDLISKKDLEDVKPGLNFVVGVNKIYLNNQLQWVVMNKYTGRFYSFYAAKETIIKLFKLKKRHVNEAREINKVNF